MQINFLPQPGSQGNQVGRRLEAILASTEIESLTIVTAWAKASGLARLRPSLEAFRARGGTSELILGIDEGGGTAEGLEIAAELFDIAEVFHDPGTRTFHPKVYIAAGPDRATAIVGSSNVTKGGLFTNYEASLQVDLDLQVNDPDAILLADLVRYVTELRSYKANCLRLDASLIEKLKADPRYRVGAEGSRRATGHTTSPPITPSLFGGAIRGLASAPAPAGPPGTTLDDEESDSVIPPAAPPTTGATRSTPPPAQSAPIGFWKQLSKFDVSTTSAPGQMIIPIGFKPFFEPLVEQFDHTADRGTRQSENIFAATFIRGSARVSLPQTRAILYEPAADHPRPNKEIRYTLLNREILESLSSGDVLVFRKDTAGTVTIEVKPAGSFPSRWGWL